MADYFRPLRRKLGVATLVMACAFMCGWVRSHISEAAIPINVGNSVTYITRLTRPGIALTKTEQIELNEQQSLRLSKKRFVIVDAKLADSSQASSSTNRDDEGTAMLETAASLSLQADRVVIFAGTKDGSSQMEQNKEPITENDDEITTVIQGATSIFLESKETVVPHWSIVLPLTALSAWLLLSKRRPQIKPEPSREPLA